MRAYARPLIRLVSVAGKITTSDAYRAVVLHQTAIKLIARNDLELAAKLVEALQPPVTVVCRVNVLKRM